MQDTQKLIAFFRDCFRADNSQQQLFDLLGRKFEYQNFLTDGDLLDGHNNLIAVDNEWGKKVDYEYQLHKKEKSLYACAVFVTGIAMVMGKETKIAAPLFFFPIRLRKVEGDYVCESTGESAVINSSLLRLLLASVDKTKTNLDDWFPFFNLNALDFGVCGRLNTFLSEKYPEVSNEELLLFPKMITESQLKKKKREASLFSVFPGIAIAMVEKPKRSMGVLSELASLANSPDHSRAVQSMFGETANKNTTEFDLRVPANLTVAQQNSITSSRQFPLSLVVGPPGTGKTFTIAALAADAIAGKNRSVLIAAASDEALDVIQHKIEKEFGLKDVVMRAKQRYKGGSVVTKLRRILSGNIRRVDQEMADKSVRKINTLRQKIVELREIYWGTHDYEELFSRLPDMENASIFTKAKTWLTRRKLNQKKLQWRTMSLLARYNAELTRELKKYLQFRTHLGWHNALENDMPAVQKLYAALKSKRGVEREQLFETISAELLRSVFPIWLAKLDELSAALPFRKELFDVVIIDEATQCDIARALPALQRAKSAVITGDPEQLRHVSFVSRGQMELFRESNQLQKTVDEIDFRKNSVLDFVLSALKTGEQVNFLDEHYRSHPSIIQFSNEQIYDSNLRIMTYSPETLHNQCVHHHRVEGSRAKGGENLKEAEKVVSIVKEIIAREKKWSPKIQKTSIGILSPLSDQVKFINKFLKEHIDLEDYKNHRILVGTPYQFQGEERDEMILSFCVCPDSHPSAFVHINKRDVFNVSITRARKQQHLVFSVGTPDLKPESFLAQLLQSDPRLLMDIDRHKNYDEIPQDVLDTIDPFAQAGQIYSGFVMGGIEVDILLKSESGWKMVDLIGFPGKYAAPISLAELDTLERLGIEIYPLSYHEWNAESASTKGALESFLKDGWEVF